MKNKQIIDRVNVKECKYYCNGKCERYEEFVEADYANYSVKCICEKENDLGTYDICDYQQLKRKEQECEELKKQLTILDDEDFVYEVSEIEFQRHQKLKATLAEIKPILELYANSKAGEEQLDGTYKIMLGGSYIMAYDPKPAKEALQKISEVENV